VKPKILVVDIETMAAKVYAWKLYDETMGINQVIEPPRILCWAAQWLGSSKVMQADERGGRDEMLAKLSGLIEEADAVISYNGDKFDLPKINGELLLNGMKPLAPVTSIDLYKTVKKLGLLSSRLEFFAIMAKIGRKIKNAGFPLWRACDEGDAKSWTKMLRYNAGDVRLTGRAYRLLRPFVRNHPDLYSALMATPVAPAGSRDLRPCPRCGSKKTKVSHKCRYTTAYRIHRVSCLGCGGWFDGSREKVK
jgi:hypothetical protein